jgi:hypothetical protein
MSLTLVWSVPAVKPFEHFPAASGLVERDASVTLVNERDAGVTLVPARLAGCLNRCLTG